MKAVYEQEIRIIGGHHGIRSNLDNHQYRDGRLPLHRSEDDLAGLSRASTNMETIMEPGYIVIMTVTVMAIFLYILVKLIWQD